jgi:hypothetical protein
MERNEELADVNSFPKIPHPPHERNQKPAEIADPPRVERKTQSKHDLKNDIDFQRKVRPEKGRAF